MVRETAALDAVLAALLPTDAETWLLRASLGREEAGRSAWIGCRERFGDLLPLFRGEHRGLKRWLPLLHEALRDNGLPAPPAFATVLRTAAFQEELRGEAYDEIAGDTLAQLQAAGVDVLVLKGPALGHLYPRPGLRHNHDLELLLREPGDLGRGLTILSRAGARPAPASELVSAGAALLEHATGLPIRLSVRLFGTPHYYIPTERLWSRRTTLDVAGVSVAVPAPDDTLLHVLGHAAASPNRASLQWVADAWFLLQHHAELDWSRLERTAGDGQLGLVLAATLPYLARELGAPIPKEVLARVSQSATRIPRLERDIFLASVRGSGEGELRRMLARLRSPRERIRLLLWLLGPSPEYLRRIYRLRSVAALPLLYVYRPFAYAARIRPWRLRSDAR
jgi:putative nucleotidyltransferase-like protein